MTRRLLFAVCGWGSIVCATAGLFVPGLPTTVFVLVASYCFTRSSPRFVRWLEAHRWFGPILQRHGTGGMSRPAKQLALWGMWTSTLLSAAMLAPVSVIASAATLGLSAVGTGVIVLGVRTQPAACEGAGAPAA